MIFTYQRQEFTTNQQPRNAAIKCLKMNSSAGIFDKKSDELRKHPQRKFDRLIEPSARKIDLFRPICIMQKRISDIRRRHDVKHSNLLTDMGFTRERSVIETTRLWGTFFNQCRLQERYNHFRRNHRWGHEG